MKTFNICSKKTYEKNGETKTYWNQVGKLRETDDGKFYIDLFMFPDTPLYVFEPKPKEESGQTDWDK